jgi:hypothetical protein
MSASSSQQANGGATTGGGKRQPTGDYDVGYCRPPQHSRFKPGHKSCGGRRRGSLNVRTLFDRAMKMKLSVHKGDKTVTMPALQAAIEKHTLKAVQGDDRAWGKVIELGVKLQYFTAQDDSGDRTGPAQPPAPKRRPSDDLIDSIDRTLLDRQEQAELAKLAEDIDRGGDVTALDAEPLLRFKHLIDKGRSKDVPPPADEPLDQAA